MIQAPPTIAVEVAPGSYVFYSQKPAHESIKVVPMDALRPFASGVQQEGIREKAKEDDASTTGQVRISSDKGSNSPSSRVPGFARLLGLLKQDLEKQQAQTPTIRTKDSLGILPFPNPAVPSAEKTSMHPRPPSSAQLHPKAGLDLRQFGQKRIAQGHRTFRAEPCLKRQKISEESGLNSPNFGCLLQITNSDQTQSEKSDDPILAQLSDGDHSYISQNKTNRSPDQINSKQKIYLDKFKKHLIRLFRSHLHDQFDSIHHRKHYRWIGKSKRNAIYEFFTSHYNVPIDVYYANEGIFARLILNTVSDLNSELGISIDQAMDTAMVQIFRKKPNLRNTQSFFTNVVIQKIWTNGWKGSAQSFSETGQQLQAVANSDPREVEGLRRQFDLIGVDPAIFLE